MKCSVCEKELIWGGDHSYLFLETEDEGIVSNHSCPNDDCSVETILIYQKT